jgi:hypothetical protein
MLVFIAINAAMLGMVVGSIITDMGKNDYNE